MPRSQPFPRHAGGMACMAGASALFAVVDGLAKWLVVDYPLGQLLFFRSAFALLPLLPLAIGAGRRGLASRRPLAHGLRAAIGLAALAAYFTAFRTETLAEVTAIGFAAPLMMTAFSALLLGETVGIRRWAAVAGGLLGVLLVLRPDAVAPGFGALAAVAGTALYALIMVLMRDMGRTESSVAIAFWFTVTATILSAASLPWQWRAPTDGDLPLLAAIGIVGGVAQLLLAQAVRLAPVSVVAPVDYLYIVYASAIGWLVWGDVPTATTLAGAALVAGCGLYVLEAERRT